jgi:PH (Pleckstrin Homology) domain-containing protein
MTQKPSNQSYNPNIDELLPGDLLSEDEEVIFAIKPSLWTVAFLSFRVVAITSAIAIIATIISPMFNLGPYASQIIGYCGLTALARVGFAFLQWFSRTYVLTDRRVIRIRGVFTIDIFQCSLVKIQNTFLTLTLPERVLGLGSIALTTAGTGAIEAIWRHTKNPLKIHHKLLTAMNAAGNKPLPEPRVGL